MTKTSKPKGTKVTTPFGRAGFSALLKPSTKFNPDGEFNAKVILDESDPATAPFIAQLQALYDQGFEMTRAELQSKADAKAAAVGKKAAPVQVKRADPPFKRVIDEDTGEPLPQFSVNARSKAAFRDPETNVVRLNKPPVVLDSQSRPVFTEPGSGSIIRFQAMAYPFFTAALGAGLQLRLVGVQVKELVAFGGFKAEFDNVDGFVETAQAPTAQPTQAARETPAPAADEDSAEWV